MDGVCVKEFARTGLVGGGLLPLLPVTVRQSVGALVPHSWTHFGAGWTKSPDRLKWPSVRLMRGLKRGFKCVSATRLPNEQTACKGTIRTLNHVFAHVTGSAGYQLHTGSASHYYQSRLIFGGPSMRRAVNFGHVPGETCIDPNTMFGSMQNGSIAPPTSLQQRSPAH